MVRRKGHKRHYAVTSKLYDTYNDYQRNLVDVSSVYGCHHYEASWLVHEDIYGNHTWGRLKKLQGLRDEAESTISKT